MALAYELIIENETVGQPPNGWTERWWPTSGYMVVRDHPTYGLSLEIWSGTGVGVYGIYVASIDDLGDAVTDLEILIQTFVDGNSNDDRSPRLIFRGATGADYNFNSRGYVVPGLKSSYATTPGVNFLKYDMSQFPSDREIPLRTYIATPAGSINSSKRWIRIRVTDVGPTWFRIKVWKDGTAEPGTWYEVYEAVDSVFASGFVGLGGKANTDCHRVYYMGISTDGSTVPVPQRANIISLLPVVAAAGTVVNHSSGSSSVIALLPVVAAAGTVVSSSIAGTSAVIALLPVVSAAGTGPSTSNRARLYQIGIEIIDQLFSSYGSSPAIGLLPQIVAAGTVSSEGVGENVIRSRIPVVSATGTVGSTTQSLDLTELSNVTWLFEVTDLVGTIYYWSTKVISYGGEDYSFRVTAFDGIRLSSGKEEMGLILPNEASFSITDKGNTISPTLVVGGFVTIRLVYLDSVSASYEELRSWRFYITLVDRVYETLVFQCEDFLQYSLRGEYPNTSLIRDLFPTSVVPENSVVPVIIGSAYIPLTPVAYAPDSINYRVGYLLGSEANRIYTVDRVRSPRSIEGKVEFTVEDGYAVNDQETFNGYIFLLPKIAPTTPSETAPDYTSVGVWEGGSSNLEPLPCRVATIGSGVDFISNNPAQVIYQLLLYFGISPDHFNTGSVTTAVNWYIGKGITLHGGWWFRRPREEILSELLTQIGMSIVCGDKIEFKIWNMESVYVATASRILKTDSGDGTFKYKTLDTRDASDSALLGYQSITDSIDELSTYVIRAKGDNERQDETTIPAQFIKDETVAQKFAIMALQRRVMRQAEISFDSKLSAAELNPGDMITIASSGPTGTIWYGPLSSYPVVVESIAISRDFQVSLTCGHYYLGGDISEGLDAYDDLSPGALVAVTDTPGLAAWTPMYAGIPPGDPIHPILIGKNPEIEEGMYWDADASTLTITGTVHRQPYDIGGVYNGLPGISMALLRYPFPRAVTLPAGLTGSQGYAEVAPTAQATFNLKKNGVSFGTMSFAIGATTATFSSTSGASFEIGDVLTIIAPATPDATLENIGFSLAGLRA